MVFRDHAADVDDNREVDRGGIFENAEGKD